MLWIANAKILTGAGAGPGDDDLHPTVLCRKFLASENRLSLNLWRN